MNTKKLQLHTPCTESWGNMEANSDGRFCQSCEKTVVDFTKMTDSEVLAFFENYKNQSICGRIKASQLNRPLLPAPSGYSIRRIWQGWRAVFSALAVGAWLVGTAPNMQARNSITTTEYRIGKGEKAADMLTDDPRGLKGQVISDDDESALHGATVYLYKGKKLVATAYTDMEGYFQFEEAFSGKKMRLEVIAHGFKSQTRNVSKDTKTLFRLDPMKNSPAMYLGGLGMLD